MRDETKCLHAGYQPKRRSVGGFLIRNVYNFSAGSAVLPEPVLQEAADEMLDYKGSGMSVMEISHRSSLFQSIIDETEQDIFYQSFFPFTEGFCYVPANDSRALYEAVDDTVCVVMIELV